MPRQPSPAVAPATSSRTVRLRPFSVSTEFGIVGDGIGASATLPSSRGPSCRAASSTFLSHSIGRSQSENRIQTGAPRPDAVLHRAVEQWMQEKLVSDQDLARIGWRPLLGALTGYLDEKGAFDAYRRSRLPWVLRPGAWQARIRRERHLAQLAASKEQALRLMAHREAPSSAPDRKPAECNPPYSALV